MKMIITILSDDDIEPVAQALTTTNFRMTRVASTGGFFRKGNTTLLLGVDDGKVNAAIELIRKSLVPSRDDRPRATVFVVPVEHYEQL